jgi:hypothetical protein
MDDDHFRLMLRDNHDAEREISDGKYSPRIMYTLFKWTLVTIAAAILVDIVNSAYLFIHLTI